MSPKNKSSNKPSNKFSNILLVPSIKELKELGKSQRRDFIYRFIDNLAYYPAKLLLYTHLTANQVTVIWIIGQIIAALFVASGDYLTMVFALLAFQAFFVIDCSDGIIARYKKQFTLNGIYLDYLGHYITNPLLLICLGIGAARAYQEIAYLFMGVLAALLFLFNKAITLNPLWFSQPEQREKVEQTYCRSQLSKQPTGIYLIFALFRLEYLFNLMFWGVLLGYAHYTLIVYTFFFFLESLRKIFTQLVNNNIFEINKLK